MTQPTMRKRTLASGRTVWVDEKGRVHDRKVEQARESCWKCGGTGTYLISGHFENGVFKGRSGPCFECASKGYTTEADDKRNNYYNNHVRRFVL